MRTHAHTLRGEGGEVGSKKDLINTAKLIAKESEEVVKMAKKVADACTDKRMKRVRGCVLTCVLTCVSWCVS